MVLYCAFYAVEHPYALHILIPVVTADRSRDVAFELCDVKVVQCFLCLASGAVDSFCQTPPLLLVPVLNPEP